MPSRRRPCAPRQPRAASRPSAQRQRFAFRPLIEALERRLVPASLYTVTALTDTGAGTGTTGDLRYCLTRANGDPGSAVQFDGTLFATHQTITLNETALPTLTANLTVTGPAAGVTINANELGRVFRVGDGEEFNPAVSLSNLTLTGGAGCDGGGILDDSTGTLTLNHCTLTGNSADTGGGLAVYAGSVGLTNCALTGNYAGGYGGGLTVYGGSVALANSVVCGNTAAEDGGGIDIEEGAALCLTGCTVSGNSASGDGGGLWNGGWTAATNSTLACNAAGNYGAGLYNDGGAQLNNCTVSGNASASDGGGIDNEGESCLALTDCTLANNASGGDGGGLWNGGWATLTNCTVSGNTACVGGGVRNDEAALALTNVLVAGNAAYCWAPDLSNHCGTVAAANSLLGDGTGSGLANGDNGNLVGTCCAPINPLLAPLGNYGGPTQTLALLPGSPAVDAGRWCGAPALDQRGLGRVNAPDIGAFESQGFTLTIVSGDNQTAPLNTALPVPFAVRVTANNPLEPVAGGVVTFAAPCEGPGGTFIESGLTATAVIGANRVATAPPFTTNGTFGSFTVAAWTAGAGNGVLFHVRMFAGVVCGNLVVGGSNANDTILVTYMSNTFSVSVNGVSESFTAGTGPGQASLAGHVIIYGLDGNDQLTMNGKFPAEIHAGNGTTVVHGGDGGNVIYGGAGPTAKLTAYAGAGNDVIVGGAGIATLYGGKGKAVLIGGTFKPSTTYDSSYAGLAALAAKWAAGTVTAADEAALKAAICAGAADTLYAGTGGTWGVASPSSTFCGFLTGRDKKSTF